MATGSGGGGGSGAGGQSSSHPCHNLSNPSKRLFWCRHCMAKFIDPIQRWRHSKTCKKIVSSNPRQEIVSTDGRILQVVAGTTEGSVVVSNLAQMEEPEPSVSKRKIRKLVMNDLKCQICERVFVSLDEMREHVKHPCRKSVPYEEAVIPVTGVSITLPEFQQKDQHGDDDEKASALNSLEANLQQMEQSLAMRSDVADEVVANQIESLLKAAQVLQQQQQQEQQATTYQLLGADDLGDVDTHYVITTNPDHYEDHNQPQFEAVTVETVATLENIVPQVAMCPEVAQQQVVLQPNIEPDDLQLISEVIAREEPEIGKHHSFVPPASRTSSTSSLSPRPHNPVSSAADPSAEPATQSPGLSNDKKPQSSNDKDNLNSTKSDEILTSEKSAADSAILSECFTRLQNKDNSNDSVCLNKEKDSVVKPKSSNCCENGCCYDPTVDDFGFRNLLDDNDSQTNQTIQYCVCKLKSSTSSSRPPPKPPKYKVHETAKKMTTRSTSMEEKKSVSNKIVKKKRKYIGGKGSLDCLAKSRRKKLKKTALQNVSDSNTNSVRTTGSSEESQDTKCDLQSVNDTMMAKDDTSIIQNPGVQGEGCDELDGTLNSVKSQNSKPKTTEIQHEACLPKTVTRKPKPAREPKCRICDRVFKSIQLLQKHNKVPCKIKHTRNLCQKVLRPKRATVEHMSSLKQKPKQNLTNKKSNKNVLRPQLLPVRRISDTTLFILPKAKKGNKKRRKSAPVFIYSPPVKEYKNTFLGIHLIYKPLPFKEKFFYDLGMISSAHLNKDSCNQETMDVCEGFSPDFENNPHLSSQEIIDVIGPCTPPPVLEKVSDLDLSLLSPSPCPDLEPPVLEVISDLRIRDSSLLANTSTKVISPLPLSVNEEVPPPVLETNYENKTLNLRSSDAAAQPQLSLDSSHNEQNESREKYSINSSLGHKSSESVEEHMSEIFSKYFAYSKTQKQDSSSKSIQQTYSESTGLRDIVSIENQEQIFDTQTKDLPSPKLQSDTDVIKELCPRIDRNISVCDQTCTISKVNEPQKTVSKSEDGLTADKDIAPQVKDEVHITLDKVTEQQQESQYEHLQPKKDSPTEDLLSDGDNTMENSDRETCQELPVCVEISTTENLEQEIPGVPTPCVTGVHDEGNIKLQLSTQPVTMSIENNVCPKDCLTEFPNENVQNNVTATSSTSKSSSARHFTDLLADLCTSQKAEMTNMDSSIWSKAQPLSSHIESGYEESTSNTKTKDSQKLGERHFMDAIMTTALQISKTSSGKVNTGSNGLCRKVQKVTVAVQTDIESFTEKMLQSSNNLLTSRADTQPLEPDLPCSDMVGSETFENTSAHSKVELPETRNFEKGKTDVKDLGASYHITEMVTDIQPALNIGSFPSETENCSDTSPMYEQEIQVETFPIQSSSQSGESSEHTSQDHSSCPPLSQKQMPLNEISMKSGLSKESTPKKGEGRNLFESLFSSLSKESDSFKSTGKSVSDVVEAITHNPLPNDTYNKEETLIFPKNAHNFCSQPNKDISLLEKLPQNLHVPQSNSQEVRVFPPPGSKLKELAQDPLAPEFVGRTVSLPLGLSRDIPDMKNRTNLLEMVAKSLGIYSDENQDPQNINSAGKQTEAGYIATESEKSSVFVNIPYVQSTSCIGEAEDSSVQIIVMNNQSASSNYTTDINVIDLPSKPEILNEQPKCDWHQVDTGLSQQVCSSGQETCAEDRTAELPKCSCNVIVDNVVTPVMSKPVTSQKSGVQVVMCGVEDLKKWDNSCIVTADKSSLETNSGSLSTGCIGTQHDQESVLVGNESQTLNLCNNMEVEENSIILPPETSSGSHIVNPNSQHTSTISSTTYLTPVINVSSSEAQTIYDIHIQSASSVPMVTDMQLSSNETNIVSDHVAMVTEDVNKPATMVTGEAVDSEVAMVTNLHSEKVNVCSGSWGEPKVMVQYVQDFDCDQNVSYIVLDNEQQHGSDPFVISESPFLQTEETILCSEEESLLNSNEQPLQAAVMN
ncbi:uncharacterized protein LOC132559757 [Ylistrum balloti]|uniref:uncharacterized protein LOC132559757 n=1 Tax=Ylistrum balloti TaxID=509963 RepID=UPI002905AE95|nr:uncharacterized protein LOC132559757 [Ylistrum balloti]